MTAEPGPAHPAAAAARLTRGRFVARNTVWSLTGQALPMLAAAIGIPVLVRGLGTEAFGVLTITWTVIGYFTLFDLGLGRALTRVIAERLGAGRTEELPSLAGTATFMLLMLGLVGGAATALATPWIVLRALQVPAALERQTIATFYLLAATLPAVLVTAGLAGVLAAYQRFGTLNLIRIPLSILSFAGPMAVLPYSHDLAHVVGAIVAVRVVGALVHLGICARLLPGLTAGVRWRPSLGVPLLRSGGWLAVVNIVWPLYASVDRLLVGAWISVGAVAYYGTPQEVTTKMWSIPGPLMNVLFPAFAANHRVDPARLRLLFLRGLKVIYCALFPVTIVLVALGGDLLRVWLGGTFADNGRAALQILAAGAFLTGLAFIPSGLIQAVGQPRKVALLLLAEIPLYLLALWWGVRTWGIAGAALAWLLRALADLVALAFLAAPLLPGGGPLTRAMTLPALGTAAALGAAFAIQSLGFPARLIFVIAVVGPFLVWAAGRGLAEERRALLAGLDLRSQADASRSSSR